jgi:hypothetical protein
MGAAGVDQVRLQVKLLQQVDQPAPAVGGLEGHRGAGRQAPEDPGQLGRVVGQVAVQQLGAALVEHRDLGALAVDVHADVNPHEGLLSQARYLTWSL